MRHIFVVTLLMLSLLWIQPLNSAMSGGNFELYADGFSYIDTDPQEGGSYVLFGSGGELASERSTSALLELRAGFEALEKGLLGFTFSTTTVLLGNLSTSSVASANLTLLVETDSKTGYSVVVTEDGNLRNGLDDIDDVGDGTVSAGVEEYGVRTSGADGQIASDTAIDGSVLVARNTGTATYQETIATFLASIATTTVTGTYQHTLTFSVTVNP